MYQAVSKLLLTKVNYGTKPSLLSEDYLQVKGSFKLILNVF